MIPLLGLARFKKESTDIYMYSRAYMYNVIQLVK